MCLRLFCFLGDNCHVDSADGDATNDVTVRLATLAFVERVHLELHPEPSVILDKDGDADDDADNDGGDGEDDADLLLCDNPKLETSTDTSNDHASNFD